MTVVSIKAAVKNVLKQARSLSAHDRISFDLLKVAIRRSCNENFDLTFAFGVCGVAVRIDLGRQEIHPRFLAGWTLSVLDVEQRWSGDGVGGRGQDLFRGAVQFLYPLPALADEFEMIMIIAAIESQVEAARARIAEQIRILIALVRYARDEDFFLL